MKKVGNEQLMTIEELEQKEKTNHAVHVAVCRTRGWNPGKSVTRDEYQKAVKAFMSAPVGRSGNRC